MKKRILLLGGFLAMAAVGVSAADVDSLYKTPTNDKMLKEVVVKGTYGSYKSDNISKSLRLDRPVLMIPQSIEVITSKLLADQQINTMSEGVVRNVSGAMRLEHWGDLYSRINMRGSRASAFRNGMNITSTWGPLNEDMSFVDHIEFVKGPAGFMMSNGEPSGIYNVVTKRPTGKKQGEVNLTTGAYDLYRAALDLDGKVTGDGRLLYRLNVMGQSKNSQRQYEFQKRFSLAPVLSYQLNDKTLLTAEYVLQYANMSNVGSYYLFSTEGYAKLPRKTSFLDAGLDPTVIWDNNLTLNLQHQFNKDWKLTAQMAYFNYQQQGSSMWPSYLDAAGNMVRRVSIWDASNESKFAQIYVNGVANTGKVVHHILGGLDFGDKEYMADWSKGFNLDSIGTYKTDGGYQAAYYGLPTFDRSKSLRQRAGTVQVNQSYTGVYLQDELGFFDDQLRLTLAGRYTSVKENSYGTLTHTQKITPRVGLSYSIDKNTAAYALYDQSFVPQSGIQRSGESVKPITGNNIEFGLKRQWFHDRWNSNVAVYRIIKNNQLSSDPSNSASESYVLQLGQTKTEGVELDVQGEIARGLSIVVNYALTNSVVTKATESYAKGDHVEGYAKNLANAWLTYRFSNGIFDGLGFSLGATYMNGRSTWSYSGASNQSLPDYFRLDGGMSWSKNGLTVNANIYNILDKYLYTGSYSTAGYYYWQAEAPVNMKLSVAYRF